MAVWVLTRISPFPETMSRDDVSQSSGIADAMPRRGISFVGRPAIRSAAHGALAQRPEGRRAGRQAAAEVRAGAATVATGAAMGAYSEAFQSPRQRLSRAAAHRSPQSTMTLSSRARFASQGIKRTSWAEVIARIQWLLVF